MLPNGLEQAFRNHNQTKEFDEFVEAHKQSVSRTEVSRKAFLGEKYGEPDRIRGNALVYRQVLLHRSINLFEGSASAAVNENAYSRVLNIRGHFETTASLGYLHRRLHSLKKSDISYETLDRDLCVQMLGVRHESIPEAPDPKNILSLFEHADKSVNLAVLGGTTDQYNMLKESYEYLCEFCHPNFHSNNVAIDLDKSVPEFKFRHGQPMRDIEFKLLGYLLLSAPIFVALYDQIPDLLSGTERANTRGDSTLRPACYEKLTTFGDMVTIPVFHRPS
jgi:hypothetical protein